MSAGDGGAPVGKRNGDKEGERRRDGREDMRKRRGKRRKGRGGRGTSPGQRKTIGIGEGRLR